MIDLYAPGAYARTAGGNLERPFDQEPVIDWMSWSINPDNGGGGGMAVWDRCRQMWAATGILDFPWLHVRTMQDLQRLIQVGEAANSPALGLNIEDVATDGLSLQAVAQHVLDFWVNRYHKPVHMATLPWVQNGQGWQHMQFAVAALEIFPDEQSQMFPGGVYDPVKVQQCIGHAFDEGLKKVTLMFKTKSPNTRERYGAEFAICHSLYTADDIPPSQEGWAAWRATGVCIRPTSEVPPVPPWYSQPYKKGAAVGPAKLPRELKPPDDGHEVMTGDDVVAIKRSISHAQRWLPWAPSQWDNRYNTPFSLGRGTANVGDSGVKGFQRQEGIPQTGQVDDVTYQLIRRARIPVGPREGAPILDSVSNALIKKAALELSPAGKIVKVRAAITDFCERAEESEELWHYTQNRPFRGLGVAPERNHENDCSGYIVLVYYWARQVTSTLVPDPSGYRYSGYGNTWDDLDGHPRVVTGNYQVGDLAHYDGHVTLCRKAGNASASVWSSFGQESGPEPLTLYYRPDFIKVVRPPLLPT